MKNIILVLVSLLTLGANAQEVPTDEERMFCVNQEFLGMAQMVVQELLSEELSEAMTRAATPEQKQAAALRLRPLVQQTFMEMIEPYTAVEEGEDGRSVINVVDEDIIAVYTPFCDSLGEITKTGAPTLDKESLVYKALLKERKAIEANIQPQMNKISELEGLIVELNKRIAEIKIGIAPELENINEIDNFVQEKLLDPGKAPEQIQAEVAEALKSPEVMIMMEDINKLLEEKFSKSLGEEVDLAIPGTDESQPVVQEPEQAPVANEWIPEFKD